MATTGGLIRVLAWLLAISLAAASLLYAVVQFDVVAAQPNLPDNTGLVDILVAQGDHLRQTWAVDLASNLLYALGFLVVVLIARPLGSLVRPGDARAGAITGVFIAAGTVGIVGQLIYVGAHDVINAIAYCDCGFKEQEVISQAWARFLVDGAVSWLINGVGIMLLVGFAATGAAIGGVSMPSGWRMLSWLIALAFLVSVIVGVVGVDDPVGPILLIIETGVLIPVWAIWLALRASDAAIAAAT